MKKHDELLKRATALFVGSDVVDVAVLAGSDVFSFYVREKGQQVKKSYDISHCRGYKERLEFVHSLPYQFEHLIIFDGIKTDID